MNYEKKGQNYFHLKGNFATVKKQIWNKVITSL